MAQERREDSRSDLSDERMIELAFTNFECAKAMIKANGEESFIPCLFEAVTLDKSGDHSDIGIALRSVLDKQFTPIIQSEDFQAF
tara:strand:- start:607 stop:861 length:255 start_codon:yes stop_codon:yes gene_type:complete